MTTNTDNAIEQSIMQDEIVHIEATHDEIEALKIESDDYTSNGTETEFWGADDRGNTWRVHATESK